MLFWGIVLPLDMVLIIKKKDNRILIDNFNFVLHKEDKVAIIGEEGNKSTGTLAHLIPKSAEQHTKTTAYLLSTLPGDIINKNQDDMMKDLVQNCVITTIDNNIKIYLKEGNADITFYNTLGVAVKQSVLNEGENIINAEDLKAGVYIWKTSSNNIVNSGKFIKK